MSYYRCKRCNYKTKLKSDMKRHLTKQIKCGKDLDAYQYTDEELINISLTLIKEQKEEKDKNNNIEDKNEKNIRCDYCKKDFSRIDSLNRHKRSYCKHIILDDVKNDIKHEIHNNIDKQLNVEKVVNINIEKQVNNYFILDKKDFNIKSFDSNWNIEHFDNYIKLFILLSKTKFTDFLSEVLKNKENLNVILEKDCDSGLVYKNDSDMYVKLKKNEILNQSMHKIYEHLQKLYDEYLNNDENPDMNIENHFLESIKMAEKSTINKYDDYIKNHDIKKQVDLCLLNIYNNKNDDALEIANNIKNLGY